MSDKCHSPGFRSKSCDFQKHESVRKNFSKVEVATAFSRPKTNTTRTRTCVRVNASSVACGDIPEAPQSLRLIVSFAASRFFHAFRAFCSTLCYITSLLNVNIATNYYFQL